MGPVQKNPRKFRDKIALQNQLQDAKDKEFMAIMQEVSGVTKHSEGSFKDGCEAHLESEINIPSSPCSFPDQDIGYSFNQQSVGPIRHRGSEQRTSPYGRSRSLSPANVRSPNNTPVILTQRKQSMGTHLDIPAHFPMHRQKSDPNLYHNSVAQSGGHSYTSAAEQASTSPSHSGGRSYRSVAVPQRRNTTGDIFDVQRPQPSFARKASEPTPPVIIVTDHGDKENSSANNVNFCPGAYRTHRSESPLDIFFHAPDTQTPQISTNLDFLHADSSQTSSWPAVFSNNQEESNQRLVASFSNVQIEDYNHQINMSYDIGHQLDPAGSPISSVPKVFCDLTNGYSDNNIDIDAMLASELEKYPTVSAMAQNYLNLS